MNEQPEQTEQEPGGGVGVFGAVVWPTHLGATVGHPGAGPRADHEPDDPYYERGQIAWELEGNRIVGRATLHVPANRPGEAYEYLIFCHGPTGLDLMIDFSKFEHPLVYERAGVMDVYPIDNTIQGPKDG